MKSNDFVILLSSLEIREAEKIPLFHDVKTISNISDEEYLDHKRTREKSNDLLIRNRTSESFKEKQEAAQTRLTKSETKPSNLKQKNSNFIRKTSTPLIPVRRPEKVVQFKVNTRIPPPPVNYSKQKKVDLKAIRDIQPIHNDLNDLIPPDVDALDIEMDHLMLTSVIDNSDDDSVSCFSSESSYFTCNEDEIDQPIVQDIKLEKSKSGIELDLVSIAPTSKEIIRKMPKTEIFKCEKEYCDFTTNSQSTMKSHNCTRT